MSQNAPAERARKKIYEARSSKVPQRESAYVHEVRVYRSEDRGNVYAVLKVGKIDSSRDYIRWSMQHPNASPEEQRAARKGLYLNAVITVDDPALIGVVRHMQPGSLIEFDGKFNHRYYEKRNGDKGLDISWKASSLRLFDNALEQQQSIESMLEATQRAVDERRQGGNAYSRQQPQQQQRPEQPVQQPREMAEAGAGEPSGGGGKHADLPF